MTEPEFVHIDSYPNTVEQPVSEIAFMSRLASKATAMQALLEANAGSTLPKTFLVLHPSQASQIDPTNPDFTPVDRYPRAVKKDPDEIGTFDGYRILVRGSA